MTIIRAVLVIVALAGVSGVAGAQSCPDAAHRAFDFWVGHWQVVDSSGAEVGRSQVSRILDGCALEERWSGGDGSVGLSLNVYDRWARKWHQTWVDKNGFLLELDGAAIENGMELRGERVNPAGAMMEHRIRWTRQSDGSVIQHWERRPRGSAEWVTVFRGRYRRVAP